MDDTGKAFRETDLRGATVEHVLELLGQRLRQEKRRVRIAGRKLSDGALARLAGVSRSTVLRLWLGKPITTDSLIRIIRTLDRLDLLQPLLVAQSPSPIERLSPRSGPSGKGPGGKGPGGKAKAPTPTPADLRDENAGDAPVPLASADAFRQRYLKGQRL